MPHSTAVADNIRAEIARRGKNQVHIAEVLGITRQAVSRRLRGDVEFRASEVTAIAAYLDVPASVLLAAEDQSRIMSGPRITPTVRIRPKGLEELH